MPCASFSMHRDFQEFENDAHDIKKLLLKTQVSEKLLRSELNLLIQHIIVQDGQNNNTYLAQILSTNFVKNE